MKHSMALSFDLTAVARQLQDDRKYATVVDAIARSASARAAKIDLDTAAGLLGRCLTMTGPVAVPGPQDNEIGETAGALFKMAVILYARGTSDGSRARRKLGFVERLPIAHRERHTRLVSLRDKAIAHDDATDHFRDGPWSQDSLVYDEWADRPGEISYSWHRTNYRANLINDLSAAIPVAHEVIEQLSAAFDQDLHGMLPELANDTNFVGVMFENMRPDEPTEWHTTVTIAKPVQ